MSDAISLRVAGAIYGGWQKLAFERSIENCAAAFSLKVTERWQGVDARRPIFPGQRYRLDLGSDVAAEGYVDEVLPTYDAATHSVNVVARCGLADIVDCAAAVDGAHEFRAVTLLELARRICAPFGVSVEAQCDTGAPFSRFAIQPGETAWQAIERAARYRALLAFSDGRKTLILTRAGLGGGASGSFVLGDNLKSGAGRFSHAERFSLIVVRSQQESADDLDAEAEFHAEGRATDEAVKRYRPTVIVGESPAPGGTLAERAEWHKAVARGRGVGVTYELQGWRDEAGALWRPNTLVHIRDAYQNIDDELLISRVRFSLSADAGRLTEIDVAPREAYDLIPEAEAKDEDGSEGGGKATVYDEASVWN